MQTEAPNIKGTYPLAGERIGPAWRAAWAMLSESAWVSGGDVAASVATSHGLDPKTTKNLLGSARRAGLLDVEYRVPPGLKAKAAYYRVRLGAHGAS